MISSTAAGARKSRRSSILKKSPSRTALADVDTNFEPSDKTELKNSPQRRFSKRVSFADANQIKEICRVADIAQEWCDSSADCDTSRLNNVANLMAPIPKRGSLPLPSSSAAAVGSLKDIRSLLSSPIVDARLPNDNLNATSGSCDMDMTNASIVGNECRNDMAVKGRAPAANSKATFASFFDNTKLGIGDLYIPSSQDSPASSSDQTDELAPSLGENPIRVQSSQTISMQDFLSSIKEPDEGPAKPSVQNPGIGRYPDINPPTYKQCIGASRLSTIPDVATVRPATLRGAESDDPEREFGKDMDITCVTSSSTKIPIPEEVSPVVPSQLGDVTQVFTKESDCGMDFTECYKITANSARDGMCDSARRGSDEVTPLLLGKEALAGETEMDVTCVTKNFAPASVVSKQPLQSSPQLEEAERTNIFDATFGADMDVTTVGQPLPFTTGDQVMTEAVDHTTVFSSAVGAEMEMTCVTGFNSAKYDAGPKCDVDQTKIFSAACENDMEVTCNIAGTLLQNPSDRVDKSERTEVFRPGFDEMEFTAPLTTKRCLTDLDEEPQSGDIQKRFKAGQDVEVIVPSDRHSSEPEHLNEAAGATNIQSSPPMQSHDPGDSSILVCDTQPVASQQNLMFDQGRSDDCDMLSPDAVINETVTITEEHHSAGVVDDPDEASPETVPRKGRKIAKVRNSIAVYKLRQEKARLNEPEPETALSAGMDGALAGAKVVEVLLDEDFDLKTKDVCLGSPILNSRHDPVFRFSETLSGSREEADADELTGAKKITETRQKDGSFDELCPPGADIPDWELHLSQSKSHDLSPHLGGYCSDPDLIPQTQDSKALNAVDIPEIREQPDVFDTSLFEMVPKLALAEVQEITSIFASQPLFDEEPAPEMRITGIRGGISDFSSPTHSDSEADASQETSSSDAHENKSPKLEHEDKNLTAAAEHGRVEPQAMDCTSGHDESPETCYERIDEAAKLAGDTLLAVSETFTDVHESKQILQNEQEPMPAEQDQMVEEELQPAAKETSSCFKDNNDQDQQSLQLLEEMKEANRKLEEMIASHESREKPPTKSQAKEFEENSRELNDLVSHISKLEADEVSAIQSRNHVIEKQKTLLENILNDLDFGEKQKRHMETLEDSLKLQQKYIQWRLHEQSEKRLEFSFLSQSLRLAVEFVENIPDVIGTSCQAKIGSYSLRSQISPDCVIPSEYELYKLLHKMVMQHVTVSQLSENYPDFCSLQMALQSISSLTSAAKELVDDVDWILCQVAFCSCDISADDSCVTVTFLPPMVGVDRFQVRFFFKQSGSGLDEIDIMQSICCNGFVTTSHEYIGGRRQLDHLGEADVREVLAGVNPRRHHLRAMVEALLGKLDHKKIVLK